MGQNLFWGENLDMIFITIYNIKLDFRFRIQLSADKVFQIAKQIAYK